MPLPCAEQREVSKTCVLLPTAQRRACELHIATLQWSEERDFFTSAFSANKLRDRWGVIHPRMVHHSFYDEERFQPSLQGMDFLTRIFTNAIGHEDFEYQRNHTFARSNLIQRYQSVNVDIQKRIEGLK